MENNTEIKEKVENLRRADVSHETIEYGLVDEAPVVRVNAVVSAVVNMVMDDGIDESFHEIFTDYTPFMANFKVSDIAAAGYYLITGKLVNTTPEIQDLIDNKDEIFHF